MNIWEQQWQEYILSCTIKNLSATFEECTNLPRWIKATWHLSLEGQYNTVRLQETIDPWSKLESRKLLIHVIRQVVKPNLQELLFNISQDLLMTRLQIYFQSFQSKTPLAYDLSSLTWLDFTLQKSLIREKAGHKISHCDFYS